jgi:sensor histidine kinase YesM
VAQQPAREVPPAIQKQINLLNARISNANFAQSDLLKEVNNTFKTMVTTIAELQKENNELKAKTKETPKKPKTQ